ncbi:MAG: hypothetical protein JNM56_20905 [Planctomycetia bacterium]|nr:hypothetical protein [Planctomycetia bacterium]
MEEARIPLTEAGWLASNDLTAMVDFLGDRLSDRKYRLFACACCRQVWTLITDPRCRQAVETAERFADGQALKSELSAARLAASAAQAAVADLEIAARNAHWAAAWAATASSKIAAWAAHKNTERAEHPALLREIAGNPFQPLPPRRSWSSTILMLAESLYDGEQCNHALRIALEKAGEPDLAKHFRAGWHPRGCWALDVILDRK